MIVEDINSQLDRQGIFSFVGTSRMERFLTENNLTAIVRMRVTKDGGFALINFEREGLDDDQINEALKEYHPRITQDAVMLKVDDTGKEFIEGFKSLNAVPSVVIDAVIFNGGYYYLYFRFHSSDEAKVTTALRSRMVKFKRFAIRYLGRSTGLIATFSEISEVIPLKYVEINGSVPAKFMRIFDDPVLVNLGVSWTREMKYVLEDEIRAVYYDKSSLLRGKTDWINEISREGRIYETSFTNPIIQYLVNGASGEEIVTLGMPQKLDGKTFSIATVVPEMILPEFFKVIYDAIGEFENWELDIHNVDSFDNMSAD